MKKYTLTEEHRAQLKPWAEKWISNAMSTKSMDDNERNKCRLAIAGLYRSAGLKEPRNIVFVSSPFVARFAGGFAASIWWKRKNSDAATDDATDAATRAATYAATRAATYDATDAATRAATYAATDDLSQWYIAKENYRDIARSLGVGDFGLKCANQAWRLWQGGNQWSAWASYISFFRHVANLPIDYSKWEHWETLSECSGPRIMHAEFCIVSDRPERILVDSQNRQHCDDGPFCRWRDGSALYSVHGVRVPAWVIEQPDKISITSIESEQNTEVRRVMIARYKGGEAGYIHDSGATKIHEDDYGTLYRKELPGDEPIVMVNVINSTPEPDGSFKPYWIRVDPQLRPLLEDGKFGEPQSMTARNAVASTFGVTGEHYEICVQT